LYPPEHAKEVVEAEERDPYYLDDTLDAYPPYHLLRGPSTPEEIAAGRAKAIKRGLLPRDHPAPSAQGNAHADATGSLAGTTGTNGAARPTKKGARKR
jgi:hypothetical protein